MGDCKRWVKQFCAKNDRFTMEEIVKISPYPRTTTIDNVNKLVASGILTYFEKNMGKRRGRRPNVYELSEIVKEQII